MHAWWTLALVALTAGCLGTPADDLIGTPEPIWSHAPPVWSVGDWWRLNVQDPFTGEQFEVTQVVSAVTDEAYLIGMPADAWSEAALILHIPTLGEVRRDDLGWDVHDEHFDALEFPLLLGNTWETRFEGLDMHAEVVHLDHAHAEIQFLGAGLEFMLRYERDAGAITRFTSSTYASFEVVEHGTAWNGDVLTAHGMDLVFLHGRVAGALDITLQPAAPVETVAVAPGYDRLTFALLLGTLIPPGGPQGVYREKVTDPHGATYEAMVLPTDGPGLKASIYAVEDPTGTWTFEHVALGPGAAAVEGIAYRTTLLTLGGGPGTST